MSRSLRVALVDDEVSVRKALGRLLSVSNLKVDAFASGQEFFDSLARQMPDCLVLDLQMPGLSGLEVLERLSRSAARLPVVIITAHDDAQSREQCFARGAAAYLTKPVDEKALLDAIALAVSE